MWSVSYIACANIIAQVSSTWWSVFLFLYVPTMKLKIFIIILLTDQPKIILPTARTIKNWASSVFDKGKSALTSLINGPEVLSSAFDKEHCLLKTLLKTLILITQVSLYLLSLLQLLWKYITSLYFPCWPRSWFVTDVWS